MSNTNKIETYKLLEKQIKGLVDEKLPLLTNLSNFVAAIKQSFKKVSWVGFYLRKDDKLFLGTFQGKVACTKIAIGKGVCGTSTETQKTIVVEDVNKFQGHITCDVESKSEIVVPIIKNNYVYAVLDLDSTEFSTFDETDKIWLGKICASLEKLNIENKTKNLLD